MLPLWVRGGKPIVIPLPQKRHLTLPTLPILLLLLGTGFLLHSLFFSPPVPASLAPAGKYTSSPFLVKPSDFIDPPPPDRPSYIPEPVEPKKKGMLVPDAVHYVYGLKPVPEGQRGEELPYYAYLAMRSALINLSPKVIYFHYEHLPTGPWWDLIRPHLTLIKTQVPESIYGRPLKHFAHKADVLRLLAMKYSGGIYLDIDIYVTKPFDDLLYYPTTLGMEASPDSRRSALDPEGLCNAIIISQPNSLFIDRWLASYETFDGGIWAQHSVVKPWASQLAREHPTEIQVLSERAFFWPMWHGDEIKKTHETSQHDFKASGQYHAWESLAMGYLSKLSPQSIRENDNSFNKMVRPFIGPKDDETYKKWKKGGN
ncbi:hypothetical protein I307_02481 [Cryptococcus deuterogattii 99/473]|uniref:Uncharacterized protein n=1 Tax=Cryptococcus deuterogattii Ram5 TaxID=1296110 RepID=A0A0D0SYC9_9TREE|nr:hypothetical protein I313_05762 [Cryptococcus deuterogattii Ram5]KIY58230.1 hypothetical protein I307_02481 [Cryptococcus deuterogattii 99/473]